MSRVTPDESVVAEMDSCESDESSTTDVKKSNTKEYQRMYWKKMKEENPAKYEEYKKKRREDYRKKKETAVLTPEQKEKYDLKKLCNKTEPLDAEELELKEKLEEEKKEKTREYQSSYWKNMKINDPERYSLHCKKQREKYHAKKSLIKSKENQPILDEKLDEKLDENRLS